MASCVSVVGAMPDARLIIAKGSLLDLCVASAPSLPQTTASPKVATPRRTCAPKVVVATPEKAAPRKSAAPKVVVATAAQETESAAPQGFATVPEVVAANALATQQDAGVPADATKHDIVLSSRSTFSAICQNISAAEKGNGGERNCQTWQLGTRQSSIFILFLATGAGSVEARVLRCKQHGCHGALGWG